MVKPSCRRFSQVVGGFKNGVDGFEVCRLLRAGAGDAGLVTKVLWVKKKIR